jgi:hypothetical protein
LSIGIVVLALIIKKTAITLIVLLLVFLILINSLIYSLNKLRNSNVFKFNRVTKLVTTEKETIPLLNVSRLKVLSEFDNNDIAFYAVLLETKSGTVIQILDSYQRNEINLIINSLISYEDFNIPVFYETSNI